MGPYLGDFKEDAIFYHMWDTNDKNGASITRSVDGTIHIYKNDGSGTEVTTGITNTEDFDSVVGVHMIKVDLDDAFYATGNDYHIVLKAATIDTETPVNSVLASFSIENRFDEVDLVKINGALTSGNNADLKLKTLDVQNSGGTAVIMKSTGSNGIGLDVAGNGTGDGLKVAGGATSGSGLSLWGFGIGAGLDSNGGASGAGAVFSGNTFGIKATADSGPGGLFTTTADNDNGLELQGKGTGSGLVSIGGLTGQGGLFQGGGTSGAGLKLEGIQESTGLEIVGEGAGHGVDITPGATGDGLKIFGGSTSGEAVNLRVTSGSGFGLKIFAANADGVNIESAQNAIHLKGTGTVPALLIENTNNAFGVSIEGAGGGLNIQGTSGGIGLKVSGGGTANAMELIAGATGTGLKITGGATSGKGLEIIGLGSGDGMTITAGATGKGLSIKGGATSGNAMEIIAGAIGKGLLIQGGTASGFGLEVEAFAGDDDTALFIHSGGGIGANIVAGGSNAGLKVAGAGVGHGIEVTSGTGSDGDALSLTALSDDGHGLMALGTGSNAGIFAQGSVGLLAKGLGTAGVGAKFEGVDIGEGLVIWSGPGATGDALDIIAKSTDGRAVRMLGAGTGEGLDIVGGGTDASGAKITGGTTNGHGLELVGLGTGNDLDADFVADITSILSDTNDILVDTTFTDAVNRMAIEYDIGGGSTFTKGIMKFYEKDRPFGAVDADFWCYVFTNSGANPSNPGEIAKRDRVKDWLVTPPT